MSLAEDIDYTDRVRPVIGVRFGILSPEKIRAMSVAEISKPISQDSLDSTLLDGRLGPRDKGEINKVSNLDARYDPGNFGHHELPKPIIQIKYYEQIIHILNQVCYKCSHLLIDKTDEATMIALKNKKGKKRFKWLVKQHKNSKKIECFNCKTMQPKFSKGKDKSRVAQIVATPAKVKEKNLETGKTEEKEVPLVDSDGEPITFNTEVIHYILKKISDEDIHLMGFDPEHSRPSWMIWDVMPIPPPTMRPSVHMENGQSSEDDLTSILNDIIKQSEKLQKLINNPDAKEKNIIEMWNYLQLHIAAYIDNEQASIDTITNRSGRPLKTLRSRIKAKRGRIRSNLMGKRVDFTSRSVITPDPNISIEQLGIPKRVAMILNYREEVTEYNISVLTRLVQNGPYNYPGANEIRRKRGVGGRRGGGNKTYLVNLKYVEDRTKIRLRPGDIVYRHLMDDDWVFFNRQPSLHKMSMMAHRAKVLLEGDTFRLNISVTTPYNADFDGDEMNMHLPRSYQTVAELKVLTAVPTQIISPQSSRPVMGLVQDAMLGSYRWTRAEHMIDLGQTMKLMNWTSTYAGELPPPDDNSNPLNPRWKAQTILSTILPPFTFRNKNVDFDITHGNFKKGVLSKESVGGKISKIVHCVWKDFGPETTRHFFDNMMNLTVQWLLMDGFSIGIQDFNLKPEITKEVKRLAQEAYKKAEETIAQVHMGKFKPTLSTTSIPEEFENQMVKLLQGTTSQAQKISYESLDPKTNRVHSTVTSGSKGSKANIVQISSLLGQQMIDGKRINEGYQRRTLPHYPKDDISPEAHGFISGNFLGGLNPAEYFLHAMAGRIGVISTAIKTATTGYAQRKLMKVMEDLQLKYDHTVRNANNFMVCYSYGGDGFDGSKLETQRFDYLVMNSLQLAEKYVFPEGLMQNYITPEAYNDFSQTSFHQEKLDEEAEQIRQDRETLIKMFRNREQPDIYSPVNFPRLLEWIRHTGHLDRYPLADLNPIEVIEKVKGLIRDIKVSNSKEVNEVCTRYFIFLIRSYMSSKRLIRDYKFNRTALDLMLLRVKQLYLDGLVAPGEMVGCIAAQSIGEPMTQLTLDQFHKSGIGRRSKLTSDVPRLKEIFALTAHPKTPSNTIILDSATLNQKDHIEALNQAQNILDMIQYTTFNDLLTEKYEIIFDPHEDSNSVNVSDRKWLKELAEFDEFDQNQETLESPWVLRYVLSSDKIRNIDLDRAVEKLHKAKLPTDVAIQIKHSGSNRKEVILRVRVEMPEDTARPIKTVKDVSKKLIMTQVKGVTKITGGDVDYMDKDLIVNGEYVSRSDKNFKKYKYQGDPKDEIINPESQQYIILTDGSNLFDLLAMRNTIAKLTTSNDIHQVLHTLGIEAARQTIVNEILSVLKDGGVSMNPRHVQLLANMMTAHGYLVSADRYGMSKTDTGPWSRATFEETTTQITNAAIYSEYDPMTGVSPNIMFGQFYKAGTNAFNIMLDEEAIMSAEKVYTPKSIRQRQRDDNRVDVATSTINDACQNLDFEFNF